ncbi:hypothetical protein MTO96_009180 [Rhipicephalus appendiculatus]
MDVAEQPEWRQCERSHGSRRRRRGRLPPRRLTSRPGSEWSTLCSLVVAGVVELGLILAVVYARRTASRSGDGNVAFRLSGGDLQLSTPYTNHTTAADVPDLCGAIPR